MLQRFAALPTKFYPEASHVGDAGQSRIAICFQARPSRVIYNKDGGGRGLRELLLMNSQRARNEKRDEGEASLEGFESRNFEQKSS